MKRYIILILNIVACLGLNAELDYQLLSEFGFGDIGPLQYSNGKIFSQTSYGYAIYEIQENGNLENISNVRFSPWMNHYYSHDKLGTYSGYAILNKREDFGSYFTIYDTSVPNEQTILYHTQIDIDNMFSAELFEDYFIRKTGEHRYTIFDYENFQSISQVDSISLVYKTKFKDRGAVLLDYRNNCYYYYTIDDTGILHKRYNLGDSERKVAIDGNKLITFSIGDINFYNITEADNLEYLGSFYLSEPLDSFDYNIAFFEDKIAFVSREGLSPVISKLYLYDVSDVSSLHSINLLDSVNISNRPNSEGYENCSFIQNGNNIYLASLNGYFLLQASINEDVITLEDIGQETIINLSPIGWLKDNIYYVQNTQRNCSLSTYSFENILDIQEIPNSFPEQSMYRLLEDDQKVTRYDEMTGIIYLYDFSGDELILEATYEPQPPLPQAFFGVEKWDGSHFIYRSLGSLYSLKYQDGQFTPTWSIMNDNIFYYKFSYVIYGNYLYEHSSDRGVIVYEFDVEEINQINSLTIPFNGENARLAGDILTINNKVVDLTYDPVNLSHRYNLNQWYINSTTVKYHDYLIYPGGEKIYENGVLVDYQRGVSIYKLVDDTPVRVGGIECPTASSVKVLPGGTVDNFDLLVYENRNYAIYSCQATPNGDLEITPVTLNASNYPNPFNPETTISYDISQKGNVTVDIYNLKGQKVKRLLNKSQEAGQHKIIWHSDNEAGKKVSSGTYLYKVKSGEEEIVKKMMLMK